MSEDTGPDAGLDPDPPADAYPDCPVVDAHVHVLETDLLGAIVEWFEGESPWTMPGLSVETLVELEDERARRR